MKQLLLSLLLIVGCSNRLSLPVNIKNIEVGDCFVRALPEQLFFSTVKDITTNKKFLIEECNMDSICLSYIIDTNDLDKFYRVNCDEYEQVLR